MMSFTDGRDSGLLLVSHFSLLTGCAVSVWLALSLQPPGQWQSVRPPLLCAPCCGAVGCHSEPFSPGCVVWTLVLNKIGTGWCVPRQL